MTGLEKILEEIKETAIFMQTTSGYGAMCVSTGAVEHIIRKHMNDGWIPVEKELPPFGKRLQATILHHEWISDYDASWVPEEEKTFHPAYTEVCEIYPMGAMWGYTCAEDDYRSDIAYIAPLKDISRPVAEITAWRPFLEAYKAERNGDSADA